MVNGLLYGEMEDLLYFDLEKQQSLRVGTCPTNIFAICATKDDVLFGGEGHDQVYSLKDKRSSPMEDILTGGRIFTECDIFGDNPEIDEVSSIITHNDAVLNAGHNLVMDGQEIFSRSYLQSQNILSIESLMYSENKLYGLVKNYAHTFSIREIKNNKFDTTVLHYNFPATKPIKIAQAQIVPYGEIKMLGGNVPFSVLSTVHSSYLDVNGQKIEGTEVNGEISRVTVLKQNGKDVEVAYSGHLREIIKATIDLETKTAKVMNLVPDCREFVLALEPVRSETLHKKLIDMGTTLPLRISFAEFVSNCGNN
jgi:hypothetical protein